jgi:hypothetical protein
MRAIASATRTELGRAWAAIYQDRGLWFLFTLMLLGYLLGASLPWWLMFLLPGFVVYVAMILCLQGPPKWILVALLLVPIVNRLWSKLP